MCCGKSLVIIWWLTGRYVIIGHSFILVSFHHLVSVLLLSIPRKGEQPNYSA